MAWSDLAGVAQKATQSGLGESITYAQPGGSPETITGIFDAEHAGLDLAGLEVATVGPRVSVVLADLPGGKALRRAQVVARGVTYEVSDIEPDGQGAAVLRLHEVD